MPTCLRSFHTVASHSMLCGPTCCGVGMVRTARRIHPRGSRASAPFFSLWKGNTVATFGRALDMRTVPTRNILYVTKRNAIRDMPV